MNHSGIIDYEQRLIQIANQGLLRTGFLREVTRLFIELSQSDALEIRTADREFHYRWVFDGTDTGHLDLVSYPRNDNGQVIPCLSCTSDFETLCHRLFHPRGMPELHIGGAPEPQYYPDIRRVIQLKKPVREIENLAAQIGYNAILLLPFYVHDGSYGLVVLKSQRTGFLRNEDVELLGELMRTFAIAVDFRRSQAALKERIKELTCLYEINQIFQEHEDDPTVLLQMVTECIPPAFQYPWLTHCRITLGKKEYKSPDFSSSTNTLFAMLFTGGRKRGRIDVFYENDPLLGEPAHFLEEETRLLELIAQKIGMLLENLEGQAERRRIEEQLRHADRLATIGQLSAGFAHELNNPLANILGFAQLLTKTFPEGSVNEDLQRIVRSSLQAREIVRKLLLFGRQVPTNLGPVNLRQVVTETLDLLTGRFEKGGVRVEQRHEGALPLIQADAPQMTQVVMNLVVNALQAMPNGGTLTLVTRATRSSIVLVVEDTGHGMNPETRRQVFMPFFTTKNVGEGTGLGLSVVHGIVTAHGGGIRVSSKPNRGSRFTVKLPLPGKERS
jgi:signal transduction histidine kinase